MNFLSVRSGLLASFCFAALSVSAAVIPVTTTSDIVNAADGLTSLREAFTAANAAADDDTIVLQAGATYVLDLCAAGPLQHIQPAHLTVQGNGALIENTCVDIRTFEATDGDGAFTLDAVEMTGVPGTVTLDGAAVFSDGGALTITNANVHGFSGSAGSEVIDGGSNGGSIQMINTQVWGNGATAVRLSLGSVTIADCVIINNTGGGVNLVDGSPLVVSNTQISGNGGRGLTTTGQGSTIAHLDNVTIENNGDTGFSCSACGTVTIEDSVVSGNGALAPAGGGGGIRIAYDQDDPADAPVTSISGSTIENNLANHSGGGIEIGIVESSEPSAPPATLTIAATRIAGNVVNGPGLGGGGIHVKTGGLVLHADSLVEDNATGIGGNGGGILLAEAGSISTPATVTIQDARIRQNTAGDAGGGAHVTTDGVVAIERVEVHDNAAATGRGGGLVIRDADATIVHSWVDNNIAGIAGGGVVLTRADSPGASLAIVASTISFNEAPFALVGHGGGLLADDGAAGLSVTIENSTFSNNTAAARGGGMSAYDSTEVTLHHATFADNAAPAGASLDLDGGTLNLQASAVVRPGGGANAALTGVTVNSAGGNFVSDASLGLGAPDIVSAADPQLGALALNGGATPTRLPGVDSPLGGRIPAAALSLATDQRGVARPQGAGIEPGAVEIAEAPRKPGKPSCKRGHHGHGHGRGHPHPPRGHPHPGPHPGCGRK